MSVVALPAQLDPDRPLALFGAGLEHTGRLPQPDEDPGRCALCGSRQGQRLTLGSNDEIVLAPQEPLPGTTGTTPFTITQWRTAPLAERRVVKAADTTVCVPCVQAGRVAFVVDTEFGMVTWDYAVAGRIGGFPADRVTARSAIKGFSADILDDAQDESEEVWVGVRVPQQWLLELAKTPDYVTWQGETWLFCCRRPMVFIGEWGQREFVQHATDGNGQALFEAIVGEARYGGWEALGWSAQESNPDLGMFMFSCPQCFGLDGHLDPS